MRYLNKFDDFGSLNESKERRAERNLKRAEKLKDKAEKALEDGDTETADKLMMKARKNEERAKELNPSIDTDKFNTELASLAKDRDEKLGIESTTDTSNPSDLDSKSNSSDSENDNFDIKDKEEHRGKMKLTDFKFINKIKKIGDEISNDELQLFLKTIQDYFDEYWEKLQSWNDFPKEYQSPYTDFTIHVRKQSIGIVNRVVFVYKESNNDKLKLVLNKKDFKDINNKEIIKNEINDVLDSEDIKNTVDKIYDVVKDREKVQPIAQPQTPTSIPVISSNVKNKIKDVIVDITKKDDVFINETVKLLINEKLNISYSNTDEDKIFNYFYGNSKKIIVKDNIDAILIKYKQQKANLKEAWYNDLDDFSDATIGSTQRATQSMRTQSSKGVVGDLMWAFNTDAKTISNDINKILLKLASAYQKELNKAIEKLPTVSMVKEEFGTTEFLVGALASGYSMKKMPMLARLVGVGGKTGASEAGAITRGGLAGVSRMGVALANPYVWLGIGIVAAGVGGWYLWNSIDEQQYQLATIFTMMFALGSPTLIAEFKQNGINIKIPKIDISKLNSMIEKGNIFGSETETKTETKKSHIETTIEEEEIFEADVALEKLFYNMMGDDFLDNRDDILDNIYTTLGMRTINLAYEQLCDDYPILINYQDEFYKAAKKEGYFEMSDNKWKNNIFENFKIKTFKDFKNK